MKKIIRFLTFNGVFFIPAIILSVMLWSGYNDSISEGKLKPDDIDRLYTFDGGNRVIGITFDHVPMTQMTSSMYDTKTKQKLRSWTSGSYSFDEMSATIQGKQLLLASKSPAEDLEIYNYFPDDDRKELVKKRLTIPSFLNSNTYQWNGRMIFSGGSEGTALILGELKVGKFLLHNLNEEDLPARPTRMEPVMNTFNGQTRIPIFEVTLKNDQKAFVSAISDDNDHLSVYVADEEDQFPIVGDAVEKQMRRDIGQEQEMAVDVEREYPNRARLVKTDGELGEVVPTPEPVYQTKVYQLNDEEVLIAGSTEEDDAKGKLTGFIYNPNTGKAASVDPIFNSLSFKYLKDSALSFHKNLESTSLYYAYNNQSTGVYDMDSKEMNEWTAADIVAMENADPSHEKSFDSFKDYVLEGGALVLNWAIWIFIPLLLLAVVFILPPILRVTRRKKLEESETLAAEIVSIQETGSYLNEQPVVRIQLRFLHEGKRIEKTVKTVVSYVQIPRPGQQILIHYHPKKQRVTLLKEGDAIRETKPEMINGAVLRKVESYGMVGRGHVVLLTFEHNRESYTIPAIQASGFEFQEGEKADLMRINGQLKMVAYGDAIMNRSGKDVTVTGTILRARTFPIALHDQTPVLLDLTISSDGKPVQRTVSQFIPSHMTIEPGATIQIQTKQGDLEKELAFANEKQGSATITSVSFTGVVGNLPLATIHANRNGIQYDIQQTIDPITGVMPGDECWIAYNERTHQALIIKYASI